MSSKDQHPSLVLQSRDKQIIHAVYLCRALLPSQINALFFASKNNLQEIDQIKISSNCRKRLELLTKAGYLRREKRHSVFEILNPPYLYEIDKPSIELLVDSFGYKPDEISWKSSNNELGDGFLKHVIDTNYVRVSFDIATRVNGFHMETWLTDFQLSQAQKKTNAKVQFVANNGKIISKALIPDSFFKITTQEYQYLNFLEVDRGTETVESKKPHSNTIANKLRRYLAYYQSGQYELDYGTKALRILFVIQGKKGSEGEKRLENIVQAAQKLGCDSRFLFTTIEKAINPKRILTEPIWVAPDHSTISLLPGE